ncbi:MAG TPA: hypothetical protein VGF08_11720 [Terriglobales bacterium]|jgi:hypothetical protein
MWGRHKKLTLLYEELRTLAVFDRLCGDAGSSADHASRQIRRCEILAEIAKLENRRSSWHWNRRGIRRGVL